MDEPLGDEAIEQSRGGGALGHHLEQILTDDWDDDAFFNAGEQLVPIPIPPSFGDHWEVLWLFTHTTDVVTSLRVGDG